MRGAYCTVPPSAAILCCCLGPHRRYVLAASGVDFRTFLGTTMIGIMPGTILYCFIGTGIQSIEDFVNGKETGACLSHPPAARMIVRRL